MTELTSQQLASDFARCGPQPHSTLLHYIADRIDRCVTSDGQHLRDATDFALFLREVATHLQSLRLGVKVLV